jgi:transcriptional regulator GlxA family with amidase domain
MSFEKVAENVGYSSARILNHHFYSLEKITLSQFRQKILSAKSSS